MPTEWWQDFFSGMALDLWRAAITPEMTRAEADFIQELLAVPAGGRILDVPCGNGRLTLELGARGYQMAGVDLAADFIREAREAAAARRLTIGWEQRDMRDLPWQRHFDGAFCFGNSFGYLTDEGNRSFLKAVFQVLKPGARLALDASSCAENVLPRFKERTCERVGDILFFEENRYDHLNCRLETQYTLVRDGKVEAKFGSHRIYTYREFCSLLAEAGFTDLQAYGSSAMDPFQMGSQGLLMVATAREA